MRNIIQWSCPPHVVDLVQLGLELVQLGGYFCSSRDCLGEQLFCRLCDPVKVVAVRVKDFRRRGQSCRGARQSMKGKICLD